MAGASAVTMFWSVEGAFHNLRSFPLVFAVITAALALVLYLTGGQARQQLKVPLGVAALCAVGVYLLHTFVAERQFRNAEITTLPVLADAPAAEIRYAVALENGQELDNLQPYSGKMTLLNFWATWCPPCREELPMLVDFYEEHRTSPIQVIGVTRVWNKPIAESTLQAEVDSIVQFAAQQNISYPLVIDTTPYNFEIFQIKSIPTTILIDSTGMVIDYGVGIDGTRRILQKLMQGQK